MFQKNPLDFVFKIDPDIRPEITWQWWFFIFFMGKKQMMVLWSFRDGKYIVCNDMPVSDSKAISDDKFHGAVASWYFDGEKMRNNYILDKGEFEVGKKRLRFLGPKNYGFEERGGKFKIFLKNKEVSWDVHSNIRKAWLPPEYSHKKFFGGKFNYKISAVERMPFQGMVDGKEEQGLCYFQKVSTNAPTIPWFWGTLHFEKKAILNFFNPFLGPDMLRDNPVSELSGPRKSLSKNMNFFDGKKLHRFSKIKVEKSEKPFALKVWGKNKEAEIESEIRSYSRACWKFRKKRPFSTLHYNEYPSEVLSFDFRSKDKEISLSDLGKGLGNLEYTWGFLL